MGLRGTTWSYLGGLLLKTGNPDRQEIISWAYLGSAWVYLGLLEVTWGYMGLRELLLKTGNPGGEEIISWGYLGLLGVTWCGK